jgi:hypothetical protein
LKEALSVMGVCTLGLLFFAFHLACRQNPEQRPENSYEDFSRMLISADEGECHRAQEKYVTLLDGAIKEKAGERDALLAQLRSRTEQAHTLRTAILDLERGITELSSQRQKIRDTRCDELKTSGAEDDGEK